MAVGTHLKSSDSSVQNEAKELTPPKNGLPDSISKEKSANASSTATAESPQAEVSAGSLSSKLATISVDLKAAPLPAAITIKSPIDNKSPVIPSPKLSDLQTEVKLNTVFRNQREVYFGDLAQGIIRFEKIQTEMKQLGAGKPNADILDRIHKYITEIPFKFGLNVNHPVRVKKIIDHLRKQALNAMIRDRREYSEELIKEFKQATEFFIKYIADIVKKKTVCSSNLASSAPSANDYSVDEIFSVIALDALDQDAKQVVTGLKFYDSFKKANNDWKKEKVKLDSVRADRKKLTEQYFRVADAKVDVDFLVFDLYTRVNKDELPIDFNSEINLFLFPELSRQATTVFGFPVIKDSAQKETAKKIIIKKIEDSKVDAKKINALIKFFETPRDKRLKLSPKDLDIDISTLDQLKQMDIKHASLTEAEGRSQSKIKKPFLRKLHIKTLLTQEGTLNWMHRDSSIFSMLAPPGKEPECAALTEFHLKYLQENLAKILEENRKQLEKATDPLLILNLISKLSDLEAEFLPHQTGSQKDHKSATATTKTAHGVTVAFPPEEYSDAFIRVMGGKELWTTLRLNLRTRLMHAVDSIESYEALSNTINDSKLITSLKTNALNLFGAMVSQATQLGESFSKRASFPVPLDSKLVEQVKQDILNLKLPAPPISVEEENAGITPQRLQQTLVVANRIWAHMNEFQKKLSSKGLGLLEGDNPFIVEARLMQLGQSLSYLSRGNFELERAVLIYAQIKEYLSKFQGYSAMLVNYRNRVHLFCAFDQNLFIDITKTITRYSKNREFELALRECAKRLNEYCAAMVNHSIFKPKPKNEGGGARSKSAVSKGAVSKPTVALNKESTPSSPPRGNSL